MVSSGISGVDHSQRTALVKERWGVRLPPSPKTPVAASMEKHQQQKEQRVNRVSPVNDWVVRGWKAGEPDEDVQRKTTPTGDPHGDAERQGDSEAPDGEHPTEIVKACRKLLRDEGQRTVGAADVHGGRRMAKS